MTRSGSPVEEGFLIDGDSAGPVTGARYADPQSAGPGCRCCWGHRLLVPPGESVGQRDRWIGIAAAWDALAGSRGLPNQQLFLPPQLQQLRL